MKLSSKQLSYFAGKNVVITGGAGGLGWALCEQIHSVCRRVFLIDLSFTDREIIDNVEFIECDVTQDEALHGATARLSEIDILINNAGVTHMSLALDTDIMIYEQTININLISAIKLTQHLLPMLIARRGHIVAISSVAGYSPLYGRSAYAASKHGLEGYCSSLYSELNELGVEVSIVRPAFIKTQPNKTAQVNAGTISPGASKRQSNGKEIGAESAAAEILTGIAKRKFYIHLGNIALFAKWLNFFTPRFYLHLMTKRSKLEFK